MASLLPDDELLRLVFWPRPCPYTAVQIREIFQATKRYVDFDGTIAAHADGHCRPTLLDEPLNEFLAEEPFIVQTWSPLDAVKFFMKTFTALPWPVLIIMPPPWQFTDEDGEVCYGKDFEALGITGATIIDDEEAQKINAPGCVILPP